MNANMVVGGALGLILGLAAGFLLFGGADAAAPDLEMDLLRSRLAELEAELEGRPVPGESVEGLVRSPEATESVKEIVKVAEPTPQGLEARVQELAESYRKRGRKTIESAETAARLKVERDLAAERAQREDLERGGAMTWLRSMQKDWNPPWELLSEPQKFGALFVRKAEGQTLDGRSITSDSRLADGDRIVYPVGKHTLDVSSLSRQSPFPKDILIEGGGMDRTLLRFNNEMRFRGDIHSLTFRDLTIHCGDNYLEAMRNGPYTLRIERCRIIGFDMGAGGSDMLSGSVGAFYASDSRIEAGFGRAPGFGNLFDVRGALVARLENCDIEGPFRSIYDRSSGAAQVFDHCRFTNLTRSNRSQIERKSDGVRFVECTFGYQPEGAESTPKGRNLSELNPDW